MKQPALGLVRQRDRDRDRAGLYLALLPSGSFARLGVVLHARPDSHAGRGRRALGRQPGFVSGMRQPAKGLALVLLTVVVALVATAAAFVVVGEGVSPPGPIPSHFAVVVVPTTFWLAIMMGGWPITSRIKNPISAGFVVVVVAYMLTFRRIPPVVQLRLHEGRAGLSGRRRHTACSTRCMALVFSRHGARRDVSRAVLRPVAADLVARPS